MTKKSLNSQISTNVTNLLAVLAGSSSGVLGIAACDSLAIVLVGDDPIGKICLIRTASGKEIHRVVSEHEGFFQTAAGRIFPASRIMGVAKITLRIEEVPVERQKL
jgi:hypothetical protein